MKSNEKYWINHSGSNWKSEVEKRRPRMNIYQTQENSILHYIETLQDSNIKVLDFGCGYGRHLKNVSEIISEENLFAVDISAKMSEPAKEFCKNINIIEPLGKLPFDDGYFDVVYSSNVLIHISPDDVGGVVQEIKRCIKDGGILIQCETIAEKTVGGFDASHNGSWAHDLKSLYQNLGIDIISIETQQDKKDREIVFMTSRKVQNAI